MQMDRTRTYGRLATGVEEFPRAWYRQDGRYFDRDGIEVLSIDAPIPPITDTSYDTMHWKTLKKMVEDLGGEWTGKPDAVAFLIDIEKATTNDLP